METLQFVAEVKKVQSKKLASLDVNYLIELYTDDPSVLALGALDGDTTIKVTVEVNNGN